MQKFRLTLCCAALASLILCGCTNHEFGEEQQANDAKNEFTKNWIKKYGPVNPEQNWNMASLVRADIKIESLGSAASVNVYNEDPAQGGMLIGVADHDRMLNLDVVKGSKQIFAEVFADGKKISSGYYDITNGTAAINGQPSAPARAASRAANQIHEHPAFHWMIACEDLGDTDDTDFNDVVLGIYHIAGARQVLIYPMAAGGTLETYVLFKNEEVGPAYSGGQNKEIHKWLKNASVTSMLNTSRFDDTAVFARVSVTEDWNMADNFSDFSIRVVGKKDATHITTPASGDAPQIICLSGEWYWPTERTHIDEAYTNFAEWNTFGEPSWINSPASGTYVNWAFDYVPTTVKGLRVTGDANTYDNMRFNGYPYAFTVTCDEPYKFYTPVFSYNHMFDEFSYSPEHELVEVDLSELDMSHCVALNGMFFGCDKLTYVNFGTNFDTSKVTEFEGMFSHARAFTSLSQLVGFTNFDTSNAEDMRSMFEYTNIANLDLSYNATTNFFNTSKVEEIETMFEQADCTYLNLSNWDISSMKNMSFAFWYAEIGTLNLTGWAVPSSDCNVEDMFNNCVIGTLICSEAFYNWILDNVDVLTTSTYHCSINTVKTPQDVILNSAPLVF